MGRVNFCIRSQLQDDIEQAVVKGIRIARRQIGTPRSADQQRVAGENTVVGQQAHGIARVARCVPRLQPHAADPKDFAVRQAKVGVRRGTETVHDDRGIQHFAQFAAGRKMIRVRMRVDQVADADARPRGQSDVMIDLLQGRIDQDRRMCFGTSQKVGLAAPRGNLLEDHGRPPPIIGRSPIVEV